MTELVKIDPKEFGLGEKKANELTKGLVPVLLEREELVKAYKECLKMEVNPENVKYFKEVRLKIRDNRTKGIEAWHKVNKAWFLAGGNFVDATKRKEIQVNQGMEDKLMEAETFQERQEAERLAKIEADRKTLIEQYTEIMPVGLGTMQQEVFDNYLTGLKAAHTARIEAEKKAEQERKKEEAEASLHTERKESILHLWGYLAEDVKALHFGQFSEEDWTKIVKTINDKKQAHEAEHKRIQAENERLEKERIEAEKKRAKELAAIEAERKRIEAERQKEIEAERKLKADLQAKLQAKEDAERKAKQDAERIERDRIEAEKKAALAPDKDKIIAWISSMEVEPCEVKTAQAKASVTVIQQKFQAFKIWAVSQTSSL